MNNKDVYVTSQDQFTKSEILTIGNDFIKHFFILSKNRYIPFILQSTTMMGRKPEITIHPVPIIKTVSILK